MNGSIGWIATAAFAASYLCKEEKTLRRLQAFAASLWILYGVSVGAMPVIVANATVAFMAVIYPWARDLAAKRRNPAPRDGLPAQTLQQSSG